MSLIGFLAVNSGGQTLSVSIVFRKNHENFELSIRISFAASVIHPLKR